MEGLAIVLIVMSRWDFLHISVETVFLVSGIFEKSHSSIVPLTLPGPSLTSSWLLISCVRVLYSKRCETGDRKRYAPVDKQIPNVRTNQRTRSTVNGLNNCNKFCFVRISEALIIFNANLLLLVFIYSYTRMLMHMVYKMKICLTVDWSFKHLQTHNVIRRC